MVKDVKEKKLLLRVENLKQYFPLKKASFRAEQLYVRANDDVSIDIYEGETLGLVGESGCGKSTLGRSLLQLYKQTDGRTIYYGKTVYETAPKYVLDILKNLPALKKEYSEAVEKEAEARASYEKEKAGDNQYRLLEKLRAAEKNAKDRLLDMAQLIGGFMLSNNLESVSEILVNEYETSIDAYKIKKRINKETVKLEGVKSLMLEKGQSEDSIKKDTASHAAKIEDLKKELKGIEKNLELIQSKIESMLDEYRDNPKFNDYNKLRDGGINLTKLTEIEMRSMRKDMQLIFQDPYSSLNPRLTVGQIVSEGLYAHNMYDKRDKNAQEYVLETLEKCGLAKYFVHRYPHQFSGGQRQRIGIARSVALQPKFIVCDEAVSALDVSIQSQIINLLLDLKEQENLTYMFISHDLSVIKYISDRVGVMYLGNIVELAPTAELYAHPMHPYTEALLGSIPTTDVDDNKQVYVLEGDIPSPIKPPPGCKFHTRCRYATDICKKVIPIFEEVTKDHFVACHHKLTYS